MMLRGSMIKATTKLAKRYSNRYRVRVYFGTNRLFFIVMITTVNGLASSREGSRLWVRMLSVLWLPWILRASSCTVLTHVSITNRL